MRGRVAVWVFETVKKSFRNVMGPETRIVTYKQLRLSAFREPPGVDQMEWIQTVIEIMAVTFGLQTASKHAGLTATNELTKEYGIDKGSIFRFTLSDLYTYMKSKREKVSRVDLDYIDRWLNKLEPLHSRLGQLFHVDQGFPLQEWTNHNVIFELVGLTSEIQAFIVNLILAWKFHYRMANPHLSLKPCINVIDEASRLLLQGAPTQDEKFIFQLVRRGREYWESFIICDQTASLLGHPVMANIHSNFSLCQSSGIEIKFIKDEMSLDKDQASMLNKLEVGQAVVKLAGRSPDPFLIKTEKVTWDRVSDEEVQKRMKPIFESMQIKPAVDLLTSMSRSSSDQENLWKKMIKHVIKNPYVGVQKRYEDLKVSGWVGDKIVSQLEDMNLVTSHFIGFGRRGDTTRFLWPTQEGFKYAGEAEIKIPGKGGFAHAVTQNLISSGLKKQGYTPIIEASFNGKSADLCFIKDGKEIAVEIEMTVNDHISENISKDFKAGFSEVWVLLKTKDQIKKAKGKVSKALNLYGHQGAKGDQVGQKNQVDQKDSLKGKVSFKLIREFL